MSELSNWWSVNRMGSRSERQNESAETYKWDRQNHPSLSPPHPPKFIRQGSTPQSPSLFFGAMVKGHFGILVSALWTSSIGCHSIYRLVRKSWGAVVLWAYSSANGAKGREIESPWRKKKRKKKKKKKKTSQKIRFLIVGNQSHKNIDYLF